MRVFCYFCFERIYDVLKSKSRCFLLIKRVNFDKIEMESKVGNPTRPLRETSFQLISEFRIKIKTVLWWNSRKIKENIISNVYFVLKKFLNWINFQNIYTFTYQKKINSYAFLLLFKVVKILLCLLNPLMPGGNKKVTHT